MLKKGDSIILGPLVTFLNTKIQVFIISYYHNSLLEGFIIRNITVLTFHPHTIQCPLQVRLHDQPGSS